MEIKPVYLFLTAFIVITMGLVVVQQASSNISGLETTSNSSSLSVFNDTDAGLSLTPAGSGISSISAKAYNNSWLSFDGVNDRIYVKEGATGDNVSFSFWVNLTTIGTNNDHILIWDNETLGQDVIHFVYRYSYSGVAIENFTTITKPSVGNYYHNGTNESIPLNVWTHVVVNIENKKTTEIYFNGVNKITAGSVNDTLEYDATYNVIGQSSAPFEGEFDEFRLYNRSLTQAEVTEIYNSGLVANKSLPTDDLVLWFPLNEGTGTDVHTFNEGDLI